MHTNALKKKLAAGETVVGCDISFPSPFIAELIGAVGFDFLLINCEYSCIGDEQVEHLVRAAQSRNITPLATVRHEGDLYGCRRMLDRGAMGIVMPSVRSRADAEAFVSACKFTPEGTRDQCGWIQTNDFGLTRTSQEYSVFANQETLCIALCENKESVDVIGDIASVPGLDVVWVGAGNLAAEYGWPGRPVMDPIVGAMCRKISEAGKIVGAGSRHGSPERMKADNIRFMVSIAHDLFRDAFIDHLKSVRET